jgi:hypothetical protein
VTSAIQVYEMGPLLHRAVTRTEYPGTTPAALFRECVTRISDPTFGLFLGMEGGEARGIAIALLPSSALMMAPQVCLAYSEGSPRLAREVAVAVCEWFKAAGYDRCLGLNLWRDDDVFMRAFRHAGSPRVFGSMVEFRF